jgi:2,4-dienoyl-CoA reductase-like NADH-dependent reductase (Old Yellow Enzyme family)
MTNGDLGLWSAAHVPPLRRITAFMKTRGVVPGIQIAHAGRKASPQRPWHGNGALTAEDLARGDEKWETVAPQVLFAERVRGEAGIMSMAVGLIVDPHFAEAILRAKAAPTLSPSPARLWSTRVGRRWQKSRSVANRSTPWTTGRLSTVGGSNIEWAIERIGGDAARSKEDGKEMRR